MRLKKHIVQPGESLYVIGKKYGLSVARLRQLNPLVSSSLRVGQELTVQIVEIDFSEDEKIHYHIVGDNETLESIADQYNVNKEKLMVLNNLSSKTVFVGQRLKVEQDLSAEEDTHYHSVKWGDSLYSIARQYQTTVPQLIELNKLKNHHLYIGQKILIKSLDLDNPHKQYHIVQPGDTLYSIARDYQISINLLRKLNQLKQDTIYIGQKLRIKKTETQEEGSSEEIEKQDLSQYLIYQVKAGDTLYGIARAYQMKVEEIKELNALTSDFLSIGQKIRVKAKKESPLPEENQPEEETPETISDSLLHLGNLNEHMRSIIESRKSFALEIKSGFDIFGPGIKSAVGRNHVNRPDDLEKVQKRLAQLNLLAMDSEESPEQIRKSLGDIAITANLIPKTIEAIERFQSKFQVRFWIEHSSRVKLMQTNQYTFGVISPNDITYRLLKEYTEYKLHFDHPHTGDEMSVRFHNFPRSEYTQFYQGVFYPGTSNPKIPLSVFEKLGLDADLAAALQYVSTHEGSFDAINSYDSAIFSFGFIQFAGNGGGLSLFLATIKKKAPQVFKEFFQKYGIDVEFQEDAEGIQKAEILVANPYDKGGKYLVKGIEAERVIRSDKQLYGVFIRSGHYLPIVTLQIDTAIRFYIQPALDIRFSISAGMLSLKDELLSDFIRSAMGRAMIFDLVVNQWTHTATQIFRTALEQVAIQNGLYTREALMGIDERKVIQKIISHARNRRDFRLSQRAYNILQSNLSWQKKS